LQRVSGWLSPDGGILLGADLQKDTDILNAAYNDQQGITEAFNLNVLNNVNTILNSNFELENFSHHAYYNAQAGRIEMHLVAELDHQVKIGRGSIYFKRGDSIHTENSYKFTLQSIATLAASAGLKLQQSWCDEDKLFSINYLVLDR